MTSSVSSAAAALRAIQGEPGPRRPRSKQLKDLTDTEGCISIAIFNHKGGVGKSTHTTQMAAALAKQGFRVAVIDADPQLSQSIQWADDDNAEGADEPGTDEAQQEDSEEDVEEWESVSLGGAGAGGAGFSLPAVRGDKLARQVDALHPDIMRDAFDRLADGDNLYDSLRMVGLSIDTAFLPELRPCNPDDYGDRLLLLPSSPELFRYNDNLVANERADMAGRVFGAYKKLMRGLAAKYRLDFILSDLGPHTDALHKTIIASHDCLQLVVDPSMAAWASTYSLLTATLPSWIQWFNGFKPRHNRGDEGYHLQASFPHILPVLGLKHMVQRDGSVNWASSNIYTSISCTMYYEQVPHEVRALYLASKDKSGAGTMLIPFLKNLEHLPVAQETGRAFLDLKRKSMEDYYQHNNLRKIKMEEVEKERRYADRRYADLAKAMASLREQLLRSMAGQQRQQQQQQQQPEGSRRKKQRRE